LTLAHHPDCRATTSSGTGRHGGITEKSEPKVRWPGSSVRTPWDIARGSQRISKSLSWFGMAVPASPVTRLQPFALALALTAAGVTRLRSRDPRRPPPSAAGAVPSIPMIGVPLVASGRLAPRTDLNWLKQPVERRLLGKFHQVGHAPLRPSLAFHAWPRRQSAKAGTASITPTLAVLSLNRSRAAISRQLIPIVQSDDPGRRFATQWPARR